MAEHYTGKRIVMETLVAEGVEHVFGNPGTTELPLIDSLLDYPSVRYVLALQEAVAVSMADAYAHASGRVGVVNLHVAPGLGNGLGSLYNAFEGGTPLVVTAGQQDSRLRLREPMLGHDLVAMAAPLTKWSVEAQSADELPLVMNRAFKTAREAPSGPVFVSLPMDVMEARTSKAPIAPSRLHPRTAPDPEGLERALELVLAARAPVIVCGDKVARSGAVDALVTLAERIGAPVWGEVLPAQINFPNRHPHFRDRMGHDQAAFRERLAGADLVLLVGGDFFEEVWYVDVDPFPEGARRIQIDAAPERLGRNYRVDCGLVADPRRALEALARAIEDAADETFADAARARASALEAQKREEREAQRARARAEAGNRPMSPARLMAELAAAVPAGTAVAAEVITATTDLLRTFDFRAPGDYLSARGGGIGQGLPSAVGMKLAAPGRPVLGLSADGSALYTVQALWTAAHHDIPVVFVIVNNRSYRILKLNMDRYRREAGIDPGRGYPHLDLERPAVDFASLARGFGVEAERIEAPEAVAPAVRAAFDSGRPWLLDVQVE